MQRVVHIFLVTCALLASSCAMAKAKVSERVVYYTSIDQHSDTLTLSGKLSVPDKPKGVIPSAVPEDSDIPGENDVVCDKIHSADML